MSVTKKMRQTAAAAVVEMATKLSAAEQRPVDIPCCTDAEWSAVEGELMKVCDMEMTYAYDAQAWTDGFQGMVEVQVTAGVFPRVVGTKLRAPWCVRVVRLSK